MFSRNKCLHLYTLKTPKKWAKINKKSATDCAFQMRNGLNVVKYPTYSYYTYI